MILRLKYPKTDVWRNEYLAARLRNWTYAFSFKPDYIRNFFRILSRRVRESGTYYKKLKRYKTKRGWCRNYIFINELTGRSEVLLRLCFSYARRVWDVYVMGEVEEDEDNITVILRVPG